MNAVKELSGAKDASLDYGLDIYGNAYYILQANIFLKLSQKNVRYIDVWSGLHGGLILFFSLFLLDFAFSSCSLFLSYKCMLSHLVSYFHEKFLPEPEAFSPRSVLLVYPPSKL